MPILLDAELIGPLFLKFKSTFSNLSHLIYQYEIFYLFLIQLIIIYKTLNSKRQRSAIQNKSLLPARTNEILNRL